ncbi:MAG TPA: type IV toxin-antitoxin system AbiEi family antitoxin, partial [Flavisolibacter sp.]|nr:type IV toxin-antitoxin system AbiEi family antitoxin [Flavisolibacter sp.]
MQALQYGYLEAFVDELRSKGKYTFTLNDLRCRYQLSDEALKKALQRLTKKKEATRIRKEFYVIVPPEYRSRGVLPTSLFIADLMKFLQKDYYTGLLSAASFYGAAHQQPQEFYVITTKPTLRPIESNKLKINFYYKKEWYKEDIKERK